VSIVVCFHLEFLFTGLALIAVVVLFLFGIVEDRFASWATHTFSDMRMYFGHLDWLGTEKTSYCKS
jgi:hypothetical protein